MSTEKKIIDFIKKNAFTKNGIITIAASCALLVIGFYILQTMAPRKGNILYGLCSVFLEQQMTFPNTIEHTYVERYPRGIRIYYKNMDAYGQQNFSYLECSFVQHPQAGVQLEHVIFKSPIKDITDKFFDAERNLSFYRVKKEKIDLFNRSRSPEAILSLDHEFVAPRPKAMF
jgi:hypothetical protein